MEDIEKNGKRRTAETTQDVTAQASGPVSCLRNERVIVRFLPKRNALVRDKGHILYGGMAERSERTFTVPMLNNGTFVDVLTKDEKEFLEEYMGLERNALGVTGAGRARWNGYKVRLFKHDTYLDLSDPEDYIRYKVLLTNKDSVAPSEEALESRPKATYQYVIVRETDNGKSDARSTDLKMRCYILLNGIKDDRDTLKCVVETLENHPVADNTTLSFLQGKAGEHIDSGARGAQRFLETASDKLLKTKVMLARAVSCGVVLNRGGMYYLRDGNLPLCESGGEPTRQAAAEFVSTPRNTHIKLQIEGEVNKFLKERG